MKTRKELISIICEMGFKPIIVNFGVKIGMAQLGYSDNAQVLNENDFNSILSTFKIQFEYDKMLYNL